MPSVSIDPVPNPILSLGVASPLNCDLSRSNVTGCIHIFSLENPALSSACTWMEALQANKAQCGLVECAGKVILVQLFFGSELSSPPPLSRTLIAPCYHSSISQMILRSVISSAVKLSGVSQPGKLVAASNLWHPASDTTIGLAANTPDYTSSIQLTFEDLYAGVWSLALICFSLAPGPPGPSPASRPSGGGHKVLLISIRQQFICVNFVICFGMEAPLLRSVGTAQLGLFGCPLFCHLLRIPKLPTTLVVARRLHPMVHHIRHIEPSVFEALSPPGIAGIPLLHAKLIQSKSIRHVSPTRSRHATCRGMFFLAPPKEPNPKGDV